MSTSQERGIEEVVEDIIHKSIDELSKQGEGYASFYVNILKAEITNAITSLTEAHNKEMKQITNVIETLLLVLENPKAGSTWGELAKEVRKDLKKFNIEVKE